MAAKESLNRGDYKEIMIAPMKQEHLEQVLAIEARSFPTPWSRQSYLGEIRDNQFAHYFVCLREGQVLGYGGMWLIVDEAHITTIAVHPEYRGRDLGKIILGDLMAKAIGLGADKITLEVRISNLVAQKLYQRMGFVPVGLRKGYYTDTQEDAIIMWKHLLSVDE